MKIQKLYYGTYSCKFDVLLLLKLKPVSGAPYMDISKSSNLESVLKLYKNNIYKITPDHEKAYKLSPEKYLHSLSNYWTGNSTRTSVVFRTAAWMNKNYGDDLVEEKYIDNILNELEDNTDIKIRHQKTVFLWESLYGYNKSWFQPTAGHGKFTASLSDNNPCVCFRIYIKNHDLHEKLIKLFTDAKIQVLNENSMTDNYSDVLQKNKNLILCNELPLNRYRYEIKLKCNIRDQNFVNLLSRSESFLEWVNELNGKIWLSEQFISELKHYAMHGRTATLFRPMRTFIIRVEDEATLALLTMQISNIPLDFKKYIRKREVSD